MCPTSLYYRREFRDDGAKIERIAHAPDRLVLYGYLAQLSERSGTNSDVVNVCTGT